MNSSALIIAEARAWIGTPYKHQASLKGVGCDCLGLVRGAWRALNGPEPEAAPSYSADWAEAGGKEPLATAAARHLVPVELADVTPGDVLLFRWRAHLPAKHAAILVAADRIVHAAAAGLLKPHVKGWRPSADRFKSLNRRKDSRKWAGATNIRIPLLFCTSPRNPRA